ncbi:MAG: glycosyltransferase family 61 protein, partial [Pseudomonadota bacterium]|nr:glycosyltransferase family 61 protein [Pseudomonadota bacterium]
MRLPAPPCGGRFVPAARWQNAPEPDPRERGNLTPENGRRSPMTLPRRFAAPRRKLDERAVACSSREDFLERRTGVHCLELHPQGRQSLRPALWKGAGSLDVYDARTRRQPSVRIYSFGDRPAALGRTAIIDAGQFLELGYLQFCETSRFHEFGNVALVEDYGEDAVVFRAPSDHLHVQGDCALVTQKGDDVWGHWLVDILPRIRMVRDLLPDVTIVLADALGCSRDLLRHARIDMRKVVVYDPVMTVLTTDRLFFPSFLRFANGFSPYAAAIFTPLRRAAERPTRKLYITRSATAAGSSIDNHAEIERLFLGRGFEVVSPQSMPLSEQVATFGQASHIAG